MFEKLSPKAIKIVMFAQEEARRCNCVFVETEHLLLGILREGNSIAAKLLNEKNMTYESVVEKLEENYREKKNLTNLEIQFSPNTRQALELAMEEAEKLNDSQVEPEHLLMGIINLGEGLAISIMKDSGVNLSRTRWHIFRLQENVSGKNEIQTPIVDSLTSDLTLKTEQKDIHSVIGREVLIEETIQTLNLYRRLNPLLLGRAGSGKSSIIIGLTQYLLDGKIYKKFQNYRVLEFDFNNLLTLATENDELIQLFKNFVNELRQIKDIILVIDNLDNIVQEVMIKSGIFANFIQLLRSKSFYFIGITTPEKYQNLIKKSELDKFFSSIDIPESNNLETKMFLEHWRNRIGEFNEVEIDNSAIDASVEFAVNCYPDLAMPLSAIKLLDLSAARKNFQRAVAQSRIRDMERHLRVLRNQREIYFEEKNLEMLEAIKKEAQFYEEEIKILTVNMSSTLRSALTARDVQLVVERKLRGENK